MDEEILERLERIERRLQALEERLPRPIAPSVEIPPVRSGQDIEAELGTRWLPRAGAIAVIGAFAYLIGLGLQRGTITPLMVAVGIGVVCVLTAALGVRLRGDREAFGNVLVGLASGGLYVDAVGSHLYRDLLSGEATVATCVAISLATVAFGARRGLPAMLSAGLFGGLLASLMPLSKEATTTSAGLLVLVSAPAFAVSGRRKWSKAVMASWGGTAFAALAVLLSKGNVAVRLLPLDAALLMAMAAWAMATDRFPESDPQGAFPIVATATTGMVSFAVWNGWGGVGHVAGLGLAVIAVGAIFRERASGRRLMEAGLVTALIAAPLGAHFFRIPALLASLALIETTTFRRRLAPIIGAQALLASLSYFALLFVRVSEEGHVGPVGPWESSLILALAASSVAAALAIDQQAVRIAAGVAIWGLATRLAVIGFELTPSAAITVVWIATFAGLLAVGFAWRRPELRQLGLVVAAATAGKVMLVDLAGLDPATKAAVLLAFGLVLLGAGYAYVRTVGRTDEGPAHRP